MASPIKIKASEVIKTVTINIKITGMKQAKIRLGIAKKLIQLAAFVAGIGCKISEGDE